MSPADWRHDVNPRGKYMPGKPAWYMYDSCQSKRSDSIGVLCSAVFWSQNNGLQLQNLTIENTLGDSVDAGNHPAVALRTDGDRYRLTTLTFSVVRTPSCHQQRCAEPSGNQPSAAYAGDQQLH